MRLRKWAKICLTIICIVSIVVMASETENLALFIYSHIIACALFIISGNLLLKYN